MRTEVRKLEEGATERKRVREAAYLLSHPGQSALASGSRAASQGGRSHSSWPRPGERQRRTHPGSALRLYQSLTAPFKHTLDIGESAALIKKCHSDNCICSRELLQNGSHFNFPTSFKKFSLLAPSHVASHAHSIRM